MEAHHQRRHANRPFQCSGCYKAYKSYDKRNSHENEKHAFFRDELHFQLQEAVPNTPRNRHLFEAMRPQTTDGEPPAKRPKHHAAEMAAAAKEEEEEKKVSVDFCGFVYGNASVRRFLSCVGCRICTALFASRFCLAASVRFSRLPARRPSSFAIDCNRSAFSRCSSKLPFQPPASISTRRRKKSGRR